MSVAPSQLSGADATPATKERGSAKSPPGSWSMESRQEEAKKAEGWEGDSVASATETTCRIMQKHVGKRPRAQLVDRLLSAQDELVGRPDEHGGEA